MVTRIVSTRKPGWDVYAQVTISVGRDEEGFIVVKAESDDRDGVFETAQLDAMAELALAAYERWRAEDERLG